MTVYVVEVPGRSGVFKSIQGVARRLGITVDEARSRCKAGAGVWTGKGYWKHRKAVEPDLDVDYLAWLFPLREQVES
jgi:hypothetical protein